MLTDQHLTAYRELGFIDSIPVLSANEVSHFRSMLDATCEALGGRISRLNAAHYHFQWAWQLSTHPVLLDCIEQLLGPNVALKSTRFFYKHARSPAFVAWHQDGITERMEDAFMPAIWLGLTDATVENGCLQLIPGSHLGGLVRHQQQPQHDNLTGDGSTAQADVDTAINVVMKAGEMSLHHPLVLHGSNPNTSDGPRIGFSATYSTPALANSLTPIAWVRGAGPVDRFAIASPPGHASFDEEVASYLRGGHAIHFAEPSTKVH